MDQANQRPRPKGTWGQKWLGKEIRLEDEGRVVRVERIWLDVTGERVAEVVDATGQRQQLRALERTVRDRMDAGSWWRGRKPRERKGAV